MFQCPFCTWKVSKSKDETYTQLLGSYACRYTVKVLDEKKIGFLIPRNEQDGSFTRDSVAESLRLVIVEEEGKAYRGKAKEMKGLFGNRDSQDRYVNSFLAYLKTHLQPQKLE
jgi:hypothetical protein